MTLILLRVSCKNLKLVRSANKLSWISLIRFVFRLRYLKLGMHLKVSAFNSIRLSLRLSFVSFLQLANRFGCSFSTVLCVNTNSSKWIELRNFVGSNSFMEVQSKFMVLIDGRSANFKRTSFQISSLVHVVSFQFQFSFILMKLIGLKWLFPHLYISFRNLILRNSLQQYSEMTWLYKFKEFLSFPSF